MKPESHKKNVIVLFSGGRTSAYMCYWLKRNRTHVWNMIFVYANTGQEHENSLDFVNICDQKMKLDLVWIETDIKQKSESNGYKIVNFNTASRKGEVFEDMISRYGLPNKDFPHCTRELKIEPIKRYAKEIFGSDYSLALGIRVDEPSRLKQSKTDNEKLYPLAYDHPKTKGDIINWWKDQHFDLQVPEHLGNCTWCWKKSDRKLWTIAKDFPEVFDFPKRMEAKYPNTSNYERKDTRVMFRRYRSAENIVAESDKDFNVFIEPTMHQGTLGILEDECADECGSFQI